MEKVPKAKKDREIFYQELLNHFNETGVIPDFDIAPVPFLESFEQTKE